MHLHSLIGKRGNEVLDSVIQSEIGKMVFQNWLQPSGTWKEVTIRDGHNIVKCHQNQNTNDLYKADLNDWALVKTFGIVYFSPLYLGAAFWRHLGVGTFETGVALKNMWGHLQQAKGQPGFDYKIFAQTEFANFKFGNLKQAGKDLVVFAPFYFSSVWGIPVGTIAATLAVGYCAFAPLSARVQLNRFEAWWRPADVQPLTDRQIEKLTVFETVKHLTDGSYSLSHVFKMHKMELVPAPAPQPAPRQPIPDGFPQRQGLGADDEVTEEEIEQPPIVQPRPRTLQEVEREFDAFKLTLPEGTVLSDADVSKLNGLNAELETLRSQLEGGPQKKKKE